MLQNLEHAGGALVMPVPKAFVKQYQLQDLLAEMPDDLPMVAGWDEMVAVGKEAA